MDLSRQLFLENGWTMPRGLMKSQDRDPRNFTLDQWQQLKRIGVNPVHLKEAIQDCWAVSKDAKSFSRELETRGLYLAKGDRGGHVVITHDGKIFAVSRVVGKRTKDVTAKLGDPDKNGDLPTVQKALERIAQVRFTETKEYIAEAKPPCRQPAQTAQRRAAGNDGASPGRAPEARHRPEASPRGGNARTLPHVYRQASRASGIV